MDGVIGYRREGWHLRVMEYWNKVLRGAGQKTVRPLGWGVTQIGVILIAAGSVLTVLARHGWGAAVVSATDYMWLAFPPLFAAFVLFVWGIIQTQRDLYVEVEDRLAALDVPNYEAWRHRDQFTIREASFLWCDRKVDGPMPPEVAEWCTAMVAAVSSGDLEFVTQILASSPPSIARDYERRHASKETVVSRAQLIEWARKHGYDPAFLRYR